MTHPIRLAACGRLGHRDIESAGVRTTAAKSRSPLHPGRYLLVVESEVDERPRWRPLPG